MPEGDTVWRAARLLDRALAGQLLTGTDFRVPQLATADLVGGTVVSTVSRGKHLLTRIDAGQHVDAAHPPEDGGRLAPLPARQRWRRPAHEARVVLRTAERTAVGFSLGIVELLPRHQEHAPSATSAPTCSAPTGTRTRRCAGCSATPPAAADEALLDQTCLAGIGNMYAAELCFPAASTRSRPSARCPTCRGWSAGRTRCSSRTRSARVQSTTGDLRERERIWVYRRDERPCRRCGTPIRSRCGPAGRERRRTGARPASRSLHLSARRRRRPRRRRGGATGR